MKPFLLIRPSGGLDLSPQAWIIREFQSQTGEMVTVTTSSIFRAERVICDYDTEAEAEAGRELAIMVWTAASGSVVTATNALRDVERVAHETKRAAEYKAREAFDAVVQPLNDVVKETVAARWTTVASALGVRA